MASVSSETVDQFDSICEVEALHSSKDLLSAVTSDIITRVTSSVASDKAFLREAQQHITDLQKKRLELQNRAAKQEPQIQQEKEQENKIRGDLISIESECSALPDRIRH